MSRVSAWGKASGAPRGRTGKVSACGRVLGWETAYRDALAAASRTPFAWGAHDCALFAAGLAGALTSTDPAAPFRGRYDDAKGALRALRRFLLIHDAMALAKDPGGLLGATAAVICGRLGWPEHEGVRWARRGDLVVATVLPKSLGIINPDGVGLGGALGICAGPDVLFVRRPRGLARVPVTACARAWRIG